MKPKYRGVVGFSLTFLFLLPVAALAADLDLVVDEAGSRLTWQGTEFHATANQIVNQRLVEVPGSPTALILWEETLADGQNVPFYAISLGGEQIDRARETSYVLKLRHGDFDPALGEPSPAAGLGAGADCNLYLVQFVTQPLAVFRTDIEALGGKIRHFVANHAHIVEMSAAVRDAVAALPYVRWIGSYHPAYRLEEFMLETRALASELYPWQRYNIQVFESGAWQKQAVAKRIREMGGEVNRPDAGKFLLEATLTPDQLFQVASWDEICFIDRWSPYEMDMNNAREYGGANHIDTFGYDGGGVRGEVFDNGFNQTHVDFQSRPLIPHGAVGSESHGASTSGICFGDGTGNPDARGLLPAGQGIIADYHTIGMAGTNRYNHSLELAQDPWYAVFQTSSVGSFQVTEYTTISADTDAAIFDSDVNHCQSQSNEGDQRSRPQAWAKNIISGGGIHHYDTLDPSDDCWCGGASIGPAADGRIKPDLCAYYDNILTTSTGPNGYTSNFGGTSGATPIICGHVGLFFDMWADGIFGNEVDPQGTVFDNKAHAATAKAVLINTAQQYPFSGTDHDLTRVHQGWGWPDVAYMYDMREQMLIIDESELLTNLQTITYALNVEPGEPEFRATLVYADPPGNPAAQEARINDLTLKVTAPGGTVYWGNVGLLANNYSTPGGGPNTVDTVENVFIENPDSGSWLIEIFADEIIQDSHVETPETDADFALVVSGVTPCSSAGTITLDRGVYVCSATAEIRVIDCDLNIDPNVIETVEVTIDSDSEPAGEAVLLTETGAASAQFAGSIDLSTTNAPGVLWVAHGDTVTATYIDEDDGMGGYNIVVTDTATVDCLGPVISNVTALNIGSASADVTFDSDEPARATVYYGLSCGALEYEASNSAYEMSPLIHLPDLVQSTEYYYAVEAEDQPGNTTYDDNGAACYSFETAEGPEVVHSFPLNSDPGWSTQGQWAFGQPTGQGGEYGGPDPTSGYTGPNVYGYNLYGDYSNYMPEYHLTSTAIDCSDLVEVSLRFQRWLGVEQPAYDHAYVRVSNNGSNWVTIWSNPEEITDYSWSYQEFDISSVADGQPTVYLRWTMGATDGGWRYCGWNIDDVEIWAIAAEPIPGDLNGDGCVDQQDLGILLADWGCTGGDCPGDCDGDGDTDHADLGLLLAHWGEGCP